MSRLEFLFSFSKDSCLAALREALQHPRTKRRAAIALHVLLPYLVAAAVLLLR